MSGGIQQNFDNRQTPGGILQGANNPQAQNGVFNDIGGNHNNIVVHHGSSRPNNKRSLHDLLQPVSASYDNHAGKKARCMFGSRKDVLDRIKEWAIDGDRPICWLNGPAGSGKSAIAHTIAEWCDGDERLAASFFFFRGTGDRDNIARLVATLAFQLSNTVKRTKPIIKKVLRTEPSITNMSLDYQFRKLIMEPILSSRLRKIISYLTKPMIMVIDALDECNSQMDEFIDAVIDAYGGRKGRFPLRIFVTSRVEEHLRVKLETPAAKDTVLQLKLQEFDASEDIRMFLLSEFKRIYDANHRLMKSCDIPEPWPPLEVLDIIVKGAAGSYIYASTFVDFIGEEGGMPHEKLLGALKAHGLDSLYMQVFLNASSQNKDTDREVVDLKRAMRSLLVLEYPLAINAHAFLLGVTPRDLVKSLLRIQSILIIPESNDTPVQLLHTSLRDFLTTRSRSIDYFIDPPTSHITVAVDCLKTVVRRSQDMPSTDEYFLYAHWNFINHLYQGLRDNEQIHPDLSSLCSLKDDLINFVGSSYDNWVNIFIKKYLLSKIEDMQDWYQRLDLPSSSPELQSILDYLNVILIHAQIMTKDFYNYHERRRRREELLRERSREFDILFEEEEREEILDYYKDKDIRIREWRAARKDFITHANNAKAMQELELIYEDMPSLD